MHDTKLVRSQRVAGGSSFFVQLNTAWNIDSGIQSNSFLVEDAQKIHCFHITGGYRMFEQCSGPLLVQFDPNSLHIHFPKLDRGQHAAIRSSRPQHFRATGNIASEDLTLDQQFAYGGTVLWIAMIQQELTDSSGLLLVSHLGAGRAEESRQLHGSYHGPSLRILLGNKLDCRLEPDNRLSKLLCDADPCQVHLAEVVPCLAAPGFGSKREQVCSFATVLVHTTPGCIAFSKVNLCITMTTDTCCLLEQANGSGLILGYAPALLVHKTELKLRCAVPGFDGPSEKESSLGHILRHAFAISMHLSECKDHIGIVTCGGLPVQGSGVLQVTLHTKSFLVQPS
mmetsp:Transcript_38764/g.101311  ORF Transcript_38764/g.101311 Transcript_38764/m.101311 type:complete len:340 (+) Transcript_38764:2208-3227(+)